MTPTMFFVKTIFLLFLVNFSVSDSNELDSKTFGREERSETNSTTTEKCPKAFQGKCECGKQNYPHKNSPNLYVVNCTNTHFTDTSMLEDLPEETNVLIFTGNMLDEMEDNIFDFMFDRNTLKYIDLSNNHITFIKGQTFHKVNSVETLILNFNQLEITDQFFRARIFTNFHNLKYLHLTNAFTDRVNASAYYIHDLEDIFSESSLKTLRRLHMEQNEIVSIGKNASLFCSLVSLEHLYLSDNKLSDIDFRVDCLKNLSHIDLRYNMITRLSEDAMDSLDNYVNTGRPLSVNLRNNPLSCDCRSTEFLEWIRNSAIQLDQVENYVCKDGFPTENIGKFVNEIGTIDCVEPSVLIHDGYSSGTVAFLSFLIVFMILIVLVFGVYHKHRFSKMIQPLVDDITRQMGYKGLANEEQPQEAHV